ncbi:hypothetical protein ABPG75_001606 [Micractinium tetrahymenae]
MEEEERGERRPRRGPSAGSARLRAGGGGVERKWQGTDLLPVAGLCLLLVAAWSSPKTAHLWGWWQPTTHHAYNLDEGSLGEEGGQGGSGWGGKLLEGLACPNTTCSEALGIPRVALLFLTKSALPHEQTWRLWLEGAVGMLPHQRLPLAQQAACGSDPEAWQRLVCACSPLRKQPSVHGLPGQHLFSLYVHPPPWPDFQGFSRQSVFSGRAVPSRVRTKWGDISLVDAERLLLAAALKDPLNERFVLISESDVPLYDPLTLYQQLLHDPRSRVKACGQYSRPPQRLWKKEMETALLKQHHMRKSSQFFGLTRRHAELVVADKDVYTSFKQHCSSYTCGGLPDEHYIPTLLAALGEEGATHCEGYGVAWHEWSGAPNAAHPWNYKASDVTRELFRKMRSRCAANATLSVRDAYRTVSSLGAVLVSSGDKQAVCSKLRGWAEAGHTYAHPLDERCYLTARKFPANTASTVEGLFLDTCRATAAKLPLHLTDAEMSWAGGLLYLLTGRACAVAVQEGRVQLPQAGLQPGAG